MRLTHIGWGALLRLGPAAGDHGGGAVSGQNHRGNAALYGDGGGPAGAGFPDRQTEPRRNPRLGDERFRGNDSLGR